MYSRDWKLTKDDWYVSPKYENMECLCILFKENPTIFKMIKNGHLNSYCRQDDPKNAYRCKYRFGCVYSSQLPDIINQIKGNKWQLISNTIRKPDKNKIEKRRDKILIVQNKLIVVLNKIKHKDLKVLEGIIKKKSNKILMYYVKHKFPKLLIKYKKETNKNAIWGNRITNIFISWINKQIKTHKKNKIEIEKEERRKIHHVIILPHIYLFLDTINKIANIFNNEIDVIIDENNIDLIYEKIKINHKRLTKELIFIRDKSKELRDGGVNLDIYNQFKPIIRTLHTHLKYTRNELIIIERLKRNIESAPYNSRARKLERQKLEEYRNKLDDDRSLLISNKLIEFSNRFDEIKYQDDYTNYINGILNYNKENYNHRKNILQIPDNLFVKIYKILSELNSVVDNTGEIDTKIDINLRESFMEFRINRMASLNNLIEQVKRFVVFADATARRDIYKNVLGVENKFFYMRYNNISNYDIYYGYPSNSKLNAKYQLWDSDTRRFTNDAYNLLDRVAWLIKLEKTEKIYITLYGIFNNRQRDVDNILAGKFMVILGGKLRIKYNIDIKELDILLCFRYSDSGKDLFKDRTVEIQFGCPGITARGTKRYMIDHNLSRAQVDYIKIDGEQEQSAGRCRGFKHQLPVKHYLLTSRISSKFENVKNIDIILRNKDLIDYIIECGEMSARQIQHNFCPDRELSNLNTTMLKMADANIGFRYRYTSSNLRVWYFKN